MTVRDGPRSFAVLHPLEAVAGPEALRSLIAVEPADGRWISKVAALNLGGQILGGQIAAQCVVAAASEAPGFLPSALHMLFVAAPSTRSPCTFTVEPLRSGRRISYRSVGVSQDDRLVARATVTLTAENWISTAPGLEWAPALPEVADPENLATRGELAAGVPDLSGLEQLMLRGHPFLDIRPVPTHLDAASRFWIRVPDAGTLDYLSQKALLTLISDFWFTLPVHAHPSARKAFGKDFLMTSIDHAIWLHGRPDCSEWILFEAQAPLVDGELAMLRAFAWSRLGAPLATVQQQALVVKQRPGGSPMCGESPTDAP